MSRDNYSQKKYQRELAKKKKKDEKIQSKLNRKNLQAQTPLGLSDGEPAVFAADSGQVSTKGATIV